MKTTHKIIKYLAIALAVAIIAGIFTSLISLANGFSGLNFAFKGSKTDVDKVLGGSESSLLYVEIAASKVNIRNGKILSGVTDNEYIDIKTEGNKLVAIEREHSKVNVNEDTYLDITVPSGIEFEKIVVITGAGSIYAEELTAVEFKLSVGAGEMEIDDLVVTQKADMESGAGNLTVKNGIIANLDAEMGVGKAKIRAKLIGECDLESGVGSLELTLLGGKENYKFDVSSGIGSVKIDGETVVGEKTLGSGPDKIDVDCGIGNIDVVFE